MRLAVALVIVGLVSLAHADGEADRAKAEELATTARRRIADASDYAGASELFLQAYELTRDLPYLVNAAVTQRKARLPHQAVATYRRCLAEGGDALTPELRAQIEADIAHITAESAQVTVRTAGEPAEIELDRRAAGTASKEAPLVVLISTEGGLRHSIGASRPGYARVDRSLGELEPGQALEVELEPAAIPTTAAVTIESDPAGAAIAIPGVRTLGLAPQVIELPPGDYEFVATLRGYDPRHDRIHLRAGEPQTLVLRMKRIPPTWWAKHRWTVYVGGALVLGAGAAFGVREAYRPDYGKSLTYP